MTEKKTLEERVEGLEGDVHEVLTNHIPHIREDIHEIWFWVRGLGIGAILVVLGLILKAILE